LEVPHDVEDLQRVAQAHDEYGGVLANRWGVIGEMKLDSR